MGITKSGNFKRKVTGGRRKQSRKKRAYERARPASNTKLAQRRVRLVRVRGGGYKLRALRLNTGNFIWRSEQMGRKTRIVTVSYHPSNFEYIRTNTLTKNAIVLIDATPFKNWYKNHYNVDLSVGSAHVLKDEEKKMSQNKKKEYESRRAKQKLPANLEEEFKAGRLLACIASKPGQVGKADGYILEGEELDFYQRKILARKGKAQQQK